MSLDRHRIGERRKEEIDAAIGLALLDCSSAATFSKHRTARQSQQILHEIVSTFDNIHVVRRRVCDAYYNGNLWQLEIVHHR